MMTWWKNARCELSIDERMVRSKARFSFKQYILNLVSGVSNFGLHYKLLENWKIISGNGLGYDIVYSL